MKKIIIFIIILLLFLLGALIYINSTNHYDIKKIIKKNYADIKLYYVNRYDNYYIFISDKNYGVLDKDFKEIKLINKEKLCKRKKNYDIIYRKDEVMYLEEILKKGKLIFNYYDINECKLIESISVGG